MAKKPRSQRRKKGTSLDGGDEGDADVNDTAEVLSENHTVATLGSDGTMEDTWNRLEDEAESLDDALIGGVALSLSSNAAAAAEARNSKLQEALANIDEYHTEKRSARREGCLRKIFRALSQYATGVQGIEYTETKIDDIIDACRHSLRAGAPAEQYAACRVLEAASVVLGADHPEFFEAIETDLIRILQSAIRATPVRIAALRAMAMAVFIGSNDDVTSERLLDICEQLAAQEYRGEQVPTALRATALDAWALLATTVHDLYIAGKDDVSMGRGLALLGLLKECLDTSTVQLRSAAGECIALIHEARLNLGVAYSEGENTTERQFAQGTWEGSDWEETIIEIQNRIAELAVESGHHMSKKSKKEQRATFREFQATIVEDESPKEIVSFRGGTIEIESWREIVQLNFIRHCLQGGFQIQLLTNPTLHAVFGANGQALNEFGGYSQLEKRLILSKTSDAAKSADMRMTRNRRVRTNAKNYFLTADGEDY